MKTLASIALGAAMLFGAATLGLQSGSASARDRHNKNWRYARVQHHKHHKHHQHYRRHK